MLGAISNFIKKTSEASQSNKSVEYLEADNQTLREQLVKVAGENEGRISAMQEEYDKLKSANSEKSLADMKYIAELEKRCEENDVNVRELRIELSGLRSQLTTMDKYPEKIQKLQSQLLDTEDRRVSLERDVADGLVEIATLSKMNDTLKIKIKELSGSDDRREFADTFEEVMREEMMAMKVAFEAKLKAAKTEAESASRKAQLEILKMQNPHTMGSMV